MPETIDERINKKISRRNFLRYSAAAAAVAVGSKIYRSLEKVVNSLYNFDFLENPIRPTYGQETGKPILRVGKLVNPVDMNSPITAEEVADSDDNKLIPYPPPLPSKTPTHWENLQGDLYAKHDDYWTYLILDLLSSTSHSYYDSMSFYFDTKRGDFSHEEKGAEGVYGLFLHYTGGRFVEEIDTSYGSGSFAYAFKKGKDYDWSYLFAPSPLNSNPHSQFKVKIKNDILWKYSSQIGFACSYLDDIGRLRFPISKMIYIAESIDTFPKGTGEAIALVGSLLITLLALRKFSKVNLNNKVTRRNYLQLILK